MSKLNEFEMRDEMFEQIVKARQMKTKIYNIYIYILKCADHL